MKNFYCIVVTGTYSSPYTLCCVFMIAFLMDLSSQAKLAQRENVLMLGAVSCLFHTQRWPGDSKRTCYFWNKEASELSAGC